MTLSVTQEVDRPLPNRRARCLLLAVQEVMGRNGLNATLNLAGLQRYIGNTPPANTKSELRASEYSALLQSIEAQYGSGARVQLIRIGQEIFQQSLALDPVAWNLLAFTNRFLPTEQRIQRSLEQLARQMAEPDGNVVVKQEGERFVLTDATSDGTYGRKGGHEVCWQTTGEIQECVRWATGYSYDVAEETCQAKGEAACEFVIGERLG